MNEFSAAEIASIDALWNQTVGITHDAIASLDTPVTRDGFRNRMMGITALALVATVGVTSMDSNDSSYAMNTVAPAVAEAPEALANGSVAAARVEASTTSSSTTSTTTEATTSTTEAPTDKTPTDLTLSRAEINRIKNEVKDLSGDEVTYIYTNIVTGNQASKEVGKIEILKSDEEQSKDNFYWDLRHNPQTLAFYATCLDQDTPNYDNCAENTDEEGMKVLEDAGKMLVEINAMELRDKAVIAEETIAKYELMEFEGVEEHNGTYQTMRLKLENGLVVGFEQSTHASRPNDPRLHFTYVDKDGNTQEIVIRGCAQITKELPPPKTPPTTSTPETTTTTTIPETTTTTTIPETTTTTTTIPEETTTTTTIPETTTTTTIPVTTSTLHPPADGPPPEATQPPYPAETTPGYVPGNAENVEETQNGDPTNLDPTPNGTETPDSQNGGVTVGGGDESVVSEPDEGAPANPNYVPSGASPGTGEGTSNNANSEDAATPTGGTPPAGSDPGFPG